MTWATKALPPFGRAWADDFVAFGGKFYFIGGSKFGFGAFSSNQLTNTVDIYDPGTDTWSSGAPIPTYLGFHFLGADATYIYAAFGRSASSGSTQSLSWNSNVYRYNPVTDVWDTLNGAGGGRAFAKSGNCGTWMGGKLYIPVSFRSTGPTVDHFHVNIYDPVANTMTTTSDITPYIECSNRTVCTSYGGRLYLLSGSSSASSSYNNKLGTYDPATNTTVVLGASPIDQSGSMSGYAPPVFVAGSGFLFLVGGFAPVTAQATEVHKYNIATGAWSTDSDAPSVIAGSSGAFDTAASSLRIVGGAADTFSGGVLNQHYTDSVVLDVFLPATTLAGEGDVVVYGDVSAPGLPGMGRTVAEGDADVTVDAFVTIDSGVIDAVGAASVTVVALVQSPFAPYVGMLGRGA